MFSKYFQRVIRLETRLYFLLILSCSRVRPAEVIPPYKVKTPDEIEKAMVKHSVVPDVIDHPPKNFLMALFRQHEEMPELGNVLDPNPLEMYPHFVNWPCDNTSLYTLIMTDPDSPSKFKPSNREYHHWLVGNIQTEVEENILLPDIFESQTLSRYIPPMPKKKTGFHRYVMLVYKQPLGRVNFTEKYLSHEAHEMERANFSTRGFAEKYQLGDPIAGSFFLSEWVKPPPATTLEPWYLPTDYEDES